MFYLSKFHSCFIMRVCSHVKTADARRLPRDTLGCPKLIIELALPAHFGVSFPRCELLDFSEVCFDLGLI